MSKPKKKPLNTRIQDYKGIKLQLIIRSYPSYQKAKRFTLGGTNQNVWIPNKHLELDGTIKPGENIDYVFRKAQRQLELAGYTEPIVGIKRRSESVNHACDTCGQSFNKDYERECPVCKRRVSLEHS